MDSIGYSSIYDPGPPPSSYYCSSLLAAGPSANPCRNLAAIATDTEMETAAPTMTTIAQKNTIAAGTTLVTQHLTQRLTTAAAPVTATSLTLGNIASAASATGPHAANSSNDSDNNSTTPSYLPSGPSSGVKGAIVVCVVVAVLLAAGIVIYFLRRRRNNMLGQQSYQHRGGGSGGGGGPSRRPSHANNGSGATNGSIGLTARLRQQSQMLFYPGHSRGAHRDEVPTPLISPANSCNSVRGVSAVASMTTTPASPKRAGAGFFASLRMSRKSSSEPRPPPRTAKRAPRSLLPSFLSRRPRGRSISPPLTSLSPPPSPTQLSARGRPDADIDADGDGRAGHNHNRASAANSGSSYYGYYGYNGNFVPYYFPSSPICAPTTNKLEPRHERTPAIRPSKQQEQQKQEQQKQQQQKHGFYNFQRESGETSQTTDRSVVPPLPPLPHSIFSTNIAVVSAGNTRGLRSSYGSYSTVTNASSTIIQATSLYGNALTTNTVEPMMPLGGISGAGACSSTTPVNTRGPVSPARPKRPHEGPLEIPDLVMPDPPPPPLFNPHNPGGRSFSMPAAAFSVSSAGRRTAPRATKAGHILPHGPPPTRALRPPPPEKQDGIDSIEPLELPPLLMRDDDEGDPLNSWSAPQRSTSHARHNHHTGNGSKPPTTTASFSSTVSTASMLSNSTAETATTATTATSMPLTLSMSMPASASPPLRQLLSYASPSTASSSLTIRPAASQKKSSTLSTEDDSTTADSLFPSRDILDSDVI